MRLVRLALRWKLLVAVAASASVSVLVTGALAAPSQPDAGATFQLVTNPTCSSGVTRLGRACVDRKSGGGWTIADGQVKVEVAGQWLTTYSWTLPQTVPPAGANLTLRATGEEKTGNPNARICPAISARSGFTFKGEAQPAGLGFCAEAVTKPTASGAKTLSLLPASAAAGSTVTVTIGVQYGVSYTYTYRAAAAKKEPPKCRKPSGLDSVAAKCEVTLRFALLHGGWPKGKPKGFLDVTTNAIGTVSFDFDSGKLAAEEDFNTPKLEPNDIVVRVVRTIHLIDPTFAPPTKKARLVFRARAGGLISYRETITHAGRGKAVDLPLELVSSNDAECSRGEDALLTLVDSPHRDDDRFILLVDCPVHSGRLKDGEDRKRPLVKVVIDRT